MLAVEIGEVVDPREPLFEANDFLGGLHRERERRASAVAVEEEASILELVDEPAGVLGYDPPEVEAVREHDDVAGEAVAAHVSRLPDPTGLGAATKRVVERAPVLRAAAVALAVSADDEQRMLDRHAGRVRAGEGGGEVETDEIVVVIELEREESLAARERRAEEELAASVGAPVRLLHEEKARVAKAVELLPEVGLELRREEASAEHVAIPEAPVFDEDPVVDSAGGRSERLGAAARDVGAKRASALGRSRRDAHCHTLSVAKL